MSYKFELVLTVWEDGLFRLRDRIEADDFDSLESQFEIAISNAKEKLTQPKYPFMEDDDIPFWGDKWQVRLQTSHKLNRLMSK